MPGENHDVPQPSGGLPDPIRRIMQVHAHVQAQAAWHIFGVASYAMRPDTTTLEALADNTRDFIQTGDLIEAATKEFVEWVDEVKKERSGGE